MIGLFILVSTSILSAQEYALTITVIDEESKNPLEGVTVLINPCECGGISNTSGIFIKRLQKGVYNLSFEYLGYSTQTLEVDLNKNQTLSVQMPVEEERLSEVVLLAQKRNQNVESPQMGVLERFD